MLVSASKTSFSCDTCQMTERADVCLSETSPWRFHKQSDCSFAIRYDIIEMVVAPSDLGWPVRRPRRLTCLVLRDKWVSVAKADEFAELFHASCSMLGCDLFAYGALEDARVQADYKEQLFRTLGCQT